MQLSVLLTPHHQAYEPCDRYRDCISAGLELSARNDWLMKNLAIAILPDHRFLNHQLGRDTITEQQCYPQGEVRRHRLRTGLPL